MFSNNDFWMKALENSLIAVICIIMMLGYFFILREVDNRMTSITENIQLIQISISDIERIVEGLKNESSNNCGSQ